MIAATSRFTRITVVLLIALLSIGVLVFQRGKWDKYYRHALSHPPRQLVVDALNLFPRNGKAIDLGCGAGNEATLLLNQGWRVWAVDSEPKAIQLLLTRAPDQERLVTTVARFEELHWNLLPEVDLFCATYSLPFCNPKEFANVWERITSKVAPGGRFAGHFFGLHYQGFNPKEMQSMTFLTKEEVLRLLQGFDIEYFRESEEEGQSGTGRDIHSHVFEVIARRKPHLD
ncbi:MAG: class I SAM-dependent methyltransferase [Chlamydiota bacterium]